jgi:hypothetical protein
MTEIDKLKAKLGKGKAVARPKVTLDLTLVDNGEIEADKTYLGKIFAARFIHLEEKTSKFDICVEVLTPEGVRIGIINDYIYTSIRARTRLRDLLLSIGFDSDTKNPSLDPFDLAERLPENHCGILTRDVLQKDGSYKVEIHRFIPIDLIEGDAQ